MAKLEFRSPPPDGRTNSELDDVAKQLRAHPGEWAVLPAGTSPAIVTQIRQGKHRIFGFEDFEATSRKIEGGFEIFIRFVG